MRSLAGEVVGDEDQGEDEECPGEEGAGGEGGWRGLGGGEGEEWLGGSVVGGGPGR